jgi:hypothetical protein
MEVEVARASSDYGDEVTARFVALLLVSGSRVVSLGLAGLFFLMGCGQQSTTIASDGNRAADVTDSQPGSYAFVKTQDLDSERPVAWDPCRPIEYYVNDALEPRRAAGLITEAVAEISDATGLRFRHLGSTSRQPWKQPQELRPAPEPVVISWVTPEDMPELSGRTAGGAGSRWDRDEATQESHYVTGQMVLDAPQLRRILRQPDGRARARAIVLHELGHLVGLLHVDDPGELMHREDVGRLELGPGDLEGLAALGSGSCFE